MQYIHIVNGDVAGAMFKQVLTQADRPDSVVVLHDDFTVGPLVDVDSIAMVRFGFWQHVAPNNDINFAAEIRGALTSLVDLCDVTTEVVIWHSQSASDQLTLRQVASHLHQSSQRISEAGMDVHELEAPNGQGSLTTTGMYSGARPTRRFSTTASTSVLRIGRLVYKWQQIVRENADTRLRKGNMSVPMSYGTVNGVILEHVPINWASARDVVDNIMDIIDGLLASDWSVFWRCREPVGNGQLLSCGRADPFST